MPSRWWKPGEDWTKGYLGGANMSQWNPWWKGEETWYSPIKVGEDPIAWGAVAGDEASKKRAEQQQSYAWLLSSAIPFLAPGQADQFLNAAIMATPAALWEQEGSAAMKKQNEDWAGWGATEAKQKESTWMNFYSPERLDDYVMYLSELSGFSADEQKPQEAELWLAMDAGVRNWIVNTLTTGANWFRTHSRAGRSEINDALTAALGTTFDASVIPEVQLDAIREMVRQIISGGRRENPNLNVGMTPFGYSGANQKYG